jgi:hypothetical protein
MSSALSQSSRVGIVGISGDQLAPVLVRVPAGGVRQLTDEALAVERIHAPAHGSPESHRNVGVQLVDLVITRGNKIRQLVQANHRLFVNPVLVGAGRRQSAVIGIAGRVHADGQRPSVGVERRLEPADAHRAILFAQPHVLFTGPKNLDRPSVQGLGDGHGLANLVGTTAAAIPAAQEGGVNEHFVRRDAGLIGGPQQAELG